MQRAKLLIVEDHRALALALSAMGERMGFAVQAVPTLALARRKLEEAQPHAVLLDLGLPDGRGLDLFAGGDGVKLGLGASRPLVAMLTAHGEIEHAIAAKKAGIDEFFVKPVDFAALEKFLQRALDQHAETREGHGFSVSFVGNAPSMRPVFQQIAQACASRQPVMICGAEGTGRSHVARLIHQHLDGGGFEVVACDALQGAPDWQACVERAAGGSIVLDRVEQLALDSQVSLADCVSSNTGVKWISIAPAAGLREAVKSHAFHPDLYYRLQGCEVHLPSLEQRREDFSSLCDLFLAELAPNRALKLDPAVLRLLENGAWEGNLRELKSVMHFAVVAATGRDVLQREDFPESYMRALSGQENRRRTGLDGELEKWLQEKFAEGEPSYRDLHESLESALLELLLERYEGNQALMARTLDMNRVTLRKKLNAKRGE